MTKREARDGPADSPRLLFDVPVGYDLKSAAAAVCMSESFLRHQIHAGLLSAHLVGRRYVVARRDLEEWLDAQPEAPGFGTSWRPYRS